MKSLVNNNKSRIRSILLVFAIIIMVVLSLLFRKEHKATASDIQLNMAPEKASVCKVLPDRESISFILGEDRENDNPYYAEAANYYLYNEEGRTEYLVTTCRSLLEVRDYLVQNPPSNNLPWGLVNLVSHGNQWMGLSARVAPGSKRASAKEVEKHISKGLFPEVPDTLLDSKSELYIHGCGIGRNKTLIQAIQLAFGGEDELPSVAASELYEYYTSNCFNGTVQNSERYLAETWSVCYKRGYKPEDHILSRQFKEQYPDMDIDWSDALIRDQPRWTGDIYHYSFEVPVKWVIPYANKDSLPDVSTKDLQIKWLRQQDDICKRLDKIGLPVEKFNWWFRMVYVKNEDGSLSPAVWVKGYCTILIVIRPVDNRNHAVYHKDIREVV